MSDEINVSEGTILEVLNNKVDIDFDNVPSNSVSFARISREVTNCITEIPQRIKYTLENGILTIKAGSVVIIPYGVEDLTEQYPIGSTFLNANFKVADTQFANGKFFVWAELVGDILADQKADNTNLIISLSLTTPRAVYGTSSVTADTTPTASTSYKFVYNTAENKCLEDLGYWEACCFPIIIADRNSTEGVTNIIQVFNGVGYIGSIFWVDKGVKGLIPEGRNADSSLKNIEFTRNQLTVINGLSGLTTSTAVKENVPLVIHYDDEHTDWWIAANIFEQENVPTSTASYLRWYRPSENKWYERLTATDDWNEIHPIIYAHTSWNGSAITNFNSKQPFRAVDYNDKSIIAGWAMPSDKYINLTFGASNTSYTAPGNGWFAVNTWTTSSATSYIHLYNSSKELAILLVPNQGTGYQQKCFVPAKKGDVIKLIYGNLDTSRSYFRFIYADGEV